MVVWNLRRQDTIIQQVIAQPDVLFGGSLGKRPLVMHNTFITQMTLIQDRRLTGLDLTNNPHTHTLELFVTVIASALLRLCWSASREVAKF